MDKQLKKMNLVKVDPTEVIEAVLEKRLAEVDPSRDLVLIKGRRKEKFFRGEQGEKGSIPRHNWIGTSLQFENPDGSFDPPIELKGDKGERGERGNDGLDGERGPMPMHEFLDGKIRFQTPIGWSKWYDVRGDRGIEGPQGLRGPQGDRGPSGPVPEHEREGQLLRFKKPNGEWGDWIDLGTQSFAGFLNPRGGGGGDAIVYDGTIAPGEKKLITQINAANLQGVSFKNYLKNSDKSLTKMFDINAVMQSGDIQYTVFGSLGSLQCIASAEIDGPWAKFYIQNNESETISYRVTQRDV